MTPPEPPTDARNILRIGLLARLGQAVPTAAMVDRVRRRIAAAGGTLTVWAVLREDIYETSFGDGFYLHLRGMALTEADAGRLAALPPDEQFVRWHVKPYRLGLRQGLLPRRGSPILLDPWPMSDEFTIADVVEVLAEIPPGGAASRLLTGPGVPGRMLPGPHLLSLPQVVGDPSAR